MDVRVVAPGSSVALSGRLGAATVADVRAALADEADAGTGDLYVDLREVELADATGLGLLIGTHRRVDRLGRRLVLQGVPERIERLLLVTRLNRVLYVDRPASSDDVIELDHPISA